MNLAEGRANLFSIQKYKSDVQKVILMELNAEFILNYLPRSPIQHE